MKEEPPPLQTTRPAFAAHAAEQLDLLEGEVAAFAEGARAQVEGVVSTVMAALTAALRPSSYRRGMEKVIWALGSDGWSVGLRIRRPLVRIQ